MSPKARQVFLCKPTYFFSVLFNKVLLGVNYVSAICPGVVDGFKKEQDTIFSIRSFSIYVRDKPNKQNSITHKRAIETGVTEMMFGLEIKEGFMEKASFCLYSEKKISLKYKE